MRYLDIPVVREVEELAQNEDERREMALYTGEDFELLFTLPSERLASARRACSFAVIGEVIEGEQGIRLEDEAGIRALEDRGYEH
jgi:thiamine-monophosphate kinase